MQVTDIQRFSTHDGPGVRTTVFLKGCPLKCRWCHNPETQKSETELLFYESKCIGCGACAVCQNGVHAGSNGKRLNRSACVHCGKCVEACPTEALELCGKAVSAEELWRIVEKDRAFYGEHGGITVSGGEPFLQAKEVRSLLTLCKEHNIHTAIETCGYFSAAILKDVVPVCDLLLWDIKDTDPVRHKEYTGVSNAPILRNLVLADSLGARARIRCILVNGVNTDTNHYAALAEIVGRLRHCEGVEWLPYHTFGEAKAIALGKRAFADKALIPTTEQLTFAKDFLQSKGIPVF